MPPHVTKTVKETPLAKEYWDSEGRHVKWSIHNEITMRQPAVAPPPVAVVGAAVGLAPAGAPAAVVGV